MNWFIDFNLIGISKDIGMSDVDVNNQNFNNLLEFLYFLTMIC